ncbi:MAG: hypothetical protein Kow0037_15490 [Calditrichia bacterium]
MRNKWLLLVMMLSLLLSANLIAGTTGKIAGSVRDASTGEPLIGANIVLKGTTMGASTDVDGYFFIINVPVGEYTLEVSMIGYQTVSYPGVKVVLDQTTKIEFRLKPEALEGEVVEVVAQQELKVEKDVTSKKVIIDRKEINSMPVRDFSDLVEAQAGIIRIEGSLKGIPGFEDRGIEEVHVRGGRTAEVAYLVDGMYTENPIYGGRFRGIQLNKFAQEQVDIKTGVFDAEYGDAMSSIINIVTRTAQDHYEGNINVETSAFGFEPDRLRNYSRFSGAIGGPVPFLGKNVTLMISGQKTDQKYNVYEFDDLVFDPSDTLANRWDRIPSGLSAEERQAYIDEHFKGIHRYDREKGWDAFGYNKSWDIFQKLNWNISPTMNLQLTNWFVETEFKAMHTGKRGYRYYEEGLNINRQNADRQTIVFTHMVSPTTFYTVKGSRFFQQMRIGVKDPNTGKWLEPDEYKAWDGPPSKNWQSDESHEFIWDTNQNKWVMGDPLPEGQKGRLFLFDPILNEWLPKDWYDGDVPLSWEFYAQGHDRYYHRNYAQTWEAAFDIVSQVTKHHQIKTGIQYKQHDLFFDEIQLPFIAVPYTEKYKKHPIEGAFFIQDKVEYDYMTINMGLRVDMNNPRSRFWENPRDKTSKLVDSKNNYQVSPRLGFSHVITEKSTFTFGYGQFYQFPTYRNVYLNDDLDLTTARPILGNALLSSEKVTQYEFGLNAELARGFVVQVIGWSKEYNNLNSTERVPSFPRTYYVNLNTDYATARGFDVNIRFRKSRVSGMLQYTYSRATANNKDPWESYRAEYTEQTQPRREYLMGYDRTHDLTLSGVYSFPKNSGPSFFGFKPLSQSRFDVIFAATSGAPYTPTHNGIAGPTNSEREPWYISTNVHFRKSFKMFGLDYMLGILVFNVLDRKNALDVYSETGKADDPGQYINRLIEQKTYTKTYWDQPYRFGPRRRVDFTLEVAF